MRRHKPIQLIGAFTILGTLLAGHGQAQESSRALVSYVGSGVHVLTEVSVTSPYVGEQFSVLYSLRSSRVPIAVDVQPQDFGGFWTEVVALPEQTRMVTRLINGRSVYEYLLRQVIAYPLTDGTLQLPPLSIKVLFNGTLSPDGRNWDLKGSSHEVPVRVLSLPTPRDSRPSPFVGTLEGRLQNGRSGMRRELFLELQGTANIAFFKPENWVRTANGAPVASRLLQAENTPQTTDIGGRRRVGLLQYRKWSILAPSVGPGDIATHDLSIPVFHPRSVQWKAVRVEGHKPPGHASSAPAEDTPYETVPGDNPPELSLTGMGAITAGLGILVAALLAWVWLRRHRTSASVHPGWAELSSLQNQCASSPRAFLENARRALERIRESHGDRAAAGNIRPLIEECLAMVDHRRFTAADPPREACERILEVIRLLASQTKTDPVRAGDVKAAGSGP